MLSTYRETAPRECQVSLASGAFFLCPVFVGRLASLVPCGSGLNLGAFLLGLFSACYGLRFTVPAHVGGALPVGDLPLHWFFSSFAGVGEVLRPAQCPWNTIHAQWCCSVMYKEPAQCDAALASGIRFHGAALRISPIDARTRLVYARDLPVEVPKDGLKNYLRAFGVVHSCSMQTYPGMLDVFTGTRVVKVTLTKDLPSSARVSGFDVRLWYQGQPQVCPVCRSYGHRVKDCPFNRLRRRCSQPGHMARECSFRRTSVDPAVASVRDPVAGVDLSLSEDEADPDYVLSSASEPGSCSGDEEVLRSAPTSVLAARVRKRSAPPAVPSHESSVDLRPCLHRSRYARVCLCRGCSCFWDCFRCS